MSSAERTCEMIQRCYLLGPVRMIHTVGKARDEKTGARDRASVPLTFILEQ